jgi:CelD/BcsL family acetyltransferase involved in cellulose biosynthesis
VSTDDFVVERHALPNEASKLTDALHALNERSRRPNPFFTPEYMRLYLIHNERDAPWQIEPFILMARRRRTGEYIAALPLKYSWDRSAPVPFRRIEFLVSTEIDLPLLLAAPEDELPAARVLLRALSRLLRSASAIELIRQPTESPLFRALDAARAPWAHVRHVPGMPMSSIHMGYADAPAYFQALNHKMRSNVSRLARRLFCEGPLEYVTASDPQVLPDMFRIYLQVQERSWKRGTDASLERHPMRVELYEQLLGKSGPLQHHVDLLLLRGQPIAAQLSTHYQRTMFAMETCFDEHYRELGPGNLMLFLAVARSIRLGDAEMSLHGHFEYYKHRWLGQTLETHDIQILRRGSVPHLRALAGTAVRYLRGQKEREVGKPVGHPELVREPRPAVQIPPFTPRELDLVARVRTRADVELSDSAGLAALLPFPTLAAQRSGSG